MIKRDARVRITASAFYGEVGVVVAVPDETEDHRYGVRVYGQKDTDSWLFTEEELQELQVGTRVLIEVQIYDFFEEAMMIAGGWMPLTRITGVLED